MKTQAVFGFLGKCIAGVIALSVLGAVTLICVGALRALWRIAIG